jgi:PAS domain S-box-containing protein
VVNLFKLKNKKLIILIYLIIGLSWTYFSDDILLSLAADPDRLVLFQKYNGAFFVITTSVVFYFLIKYYTDNLKSQKKELQDKNEQLKQSNQKINVTNKKLDRSFNELNKLNKRFVKMINTVSELNEDTEAGEEEFLTRLLHNAVDIVPEADYGKIYVFEGEKIRFVNTIGHNFNILKKIKIEKNAVFKNESEGIYHSQDYSINLNLLNKDAKECFLKALQPIKESIYIDIRVDENLIGRISLDIATDNNCTFSNTSKSILKSFSTLASSFFAYKRYDSLQGRFTKELISSIINILEMYDFYTKGHSESVANLSLVIAEKMGLPNKMALDAYWAGMVHDIGKLLIPLRMINKRTKLDDDEYDLVKKHPVWGSRALSDSPVLRDLSKYVLYHHEKWDGRGYPEGLKGEEIPLISQILSVADAWDAMTSNRSYRKSLSKEKALIELRKNKGTQFSPEVIDVFLEVLEEENLNILSEVEDKFNELESQEITLEAPEYFDQLFTHLDQGMVMLDHNFDILKVNEYFLSMFGYNEKEILGFNIEDILTPAENIEEMKEIIEKLSQGDDISTKTYQKKKSGDIVSTAVQAFSIKLSENEEGYYFVYRDISEVERAKTKYNDFKRRYRALFYNKDLKMLIVEPSSGDIIDANPGALEFYGWQKNTLLSMKLSDISLRSADKIKEELLSAKKSKGKYILAEHQTSAGNMEEVELYLKPINFADKEYLYILINKSSNQDEENVGTKEYEYSS